MLRNWPLLFIVIPLVELYFMIKVGEYIGAFWTIALVLITAFIGVNMLRYQGMNMLTRAQRSLSQGTLPAMEMMEGMVLAVGGVLLITPGFITDILGFLCMIPVTRRIIIRTIISRGSIHQSHFESGDFYEQPHKDEFIDGFQHGREQKKTTEPVRKGRTIEGECHHED